MSLRASARLARHWPRCYARWTRPIRATERCTMVESASRPNILPLHSAVTPSSSFVAYAETLEYDTQHALEFIDITADVQNVVARSGVQFGQVVAMSKDRKSTRLNSSH